MEPLKAPEVTSMMKNSELLGNVPKTRRLQGQIDSARSALQQRFWAEILYHLGGPPSEGKVVDNTIPCQRLLSLLILDKGTAVGVSGTLATVTAARVWDGGRGAK